MTRKTQLKILLAEDDLMITLSLKELLTKLDHRVIAVARNGLEAIQMTKKFQPDLIIMDIKMPELDGIEAARIIREERPTPVIILTAYSDESLVERASQAGVLTYLVKPVSEADLRPALKLAIDQFHERRTLAAEVSRTKQVLENRIVIDRAKWILVQKLGCTEERAHRIIQQISRDRNTRITDTARTIVSNKGVLPFLYDMIQMNSPPSGNR